MYFQTDEEISASATLTQVAIINTQGVSIASGEKVKIVHATTPSTYQVVTLTADIGPDDTVMEFEETTFTSTFPDASLIVPYDDSVVPLFPGPPYEYRNKHYNNSLHKFPTWYVLPDPEYKTDTLINKQIKVWRNGNLMTFAYSPEGQDQWGIDTEANTITFPVPFIYERIDIEAKGEG